MREFPSAVDRLRAVVLIVLPVGCVVSGLWLGTVAPVAGIFCIGGGILTGLLFPVLHRNRSAETDTRTGAGSGSSAARTGARAEEFAADWLKREKKFRILSQNWRHKRDELDIVARDGKVLVFVEVRARSAEALVSGYHSVNRKKKEALRRVALAYLRRCRPAPGHFRFDIVEIELNNGRPESLRHYENTPVFRKNDISNH